MAIGLGAALLGTAAPVLAVDALDDLPDAPGREIVFAYCTACHGIKIVRQQGMSVGRWDDKIQEMVEKNGLKLPPDDTRQVIVAYLAKALPERRGRPNPFQ